MTKDRSLVTQSPEELSKARQSSSLIDKHLSEIASKTRDLSKVIEKIEFKDGFYEGEVLDGIPHGHGNWTHPEPVNPGRFKG